MRRCFRFTEEKRREDSSQNYEYIVFHDLCQCSTADDRRIPFAYPVLILFGASKDAMLYAYPYMMIYLIGTLPSMIAVGMNPFINAQGYSVTGMSSVVVGAAANLILDPVFIFILTRRKRSSNRNSIVTDDIRNICIFLPFKKSRIESPAFAKEEIGYVADMPETL